MASWRKRLETIVTDRRPVSYTFKELSGLLTSHLGFELSPGDGSHRMFRREVPDQASPSGRRTVIIGLLDKGHGTQPPEYVKKMVQILRANELLPEGVE